MSIDLSLFAGYPDDLVRRVESLIKEKKVRPYIEQRYPDKHEITTNSALFKYVQNVKNSFMKKAPPLQKVVFDDSIISAQKALGLHSFISQVQGKNLKSKNEIRIASLFKKAPALFLDMIVVHELAHLREKDHNKKFFNLCSHMIPDYHQVDFDLKLYLISLEN